MTSEYKYKRDVILGTLALVAIGCAIYYSWDISPLGLDKRVSKLERGGKLVELEIFGGAVRGPYIEAKGDGMHFYDELGEIAILDTGGDLVFGDYDQTLNKRCIPTDYTKRRLGSLALRFYSALNHGPTND